MIKKIGSPALAGTMLLISALSGACYADSSTTAEYCSSSKLYATNVRRSCSQLGANGMAALYQTSDFINGLKAAPDSISEKPMSAPQVITTLEQSS